MLVAYRMIRLMIKNIGPLEDRILVFGGPYSNLQATQAILEKAKALSIPANHIICTGDVVAYCAQPEETACLVSESSIHTIQGNCEENLANDIDHCGCGFDEESLCNILANKWYQFLQKNISQEMVSWMGSLPQRIEFTFSGKKFHALHGAHRNISEFLFASQSDDDILKQIEQTDSDIILSGHSGLPFTKIIGDKAWHNAGAIGMPANDGTARTWYSIIRGGEDGEIIFEHHALEYDHQKTANIMKESGLIDYASAIETGLWPSCDVLPAYENAQTGQRIEETKVVLI